MSIWPWLIGAVLLLLMGLARYGFGIVRAYLEAPVGIALPVILFFLFVAVPQMSGMMTATIGGTDLSGVYDEAWWHQTDVPLCDMLFGLQAWYWTRAALNAAAGRRDATRQPSPAGETWAARLLVFATCGLGILPLWVVCGCFAPWRAPGLPWIGVGLSVLCSAVLLIFLMKRRDWFPVTPGHGPLPASLTSRLFACAPYGPWVAGGALVLALLLIAAFEFLQPFVDRNLHTTSAVLLAASCAVALGTVWLSILRDLCRAGLTALGSTQERAVRVARFLGAFVLLLQPFAGSWLGARFGAYTVEHPPVDAQQPARQPLSVWLNSQTSCDAVAKGPPVILALAGGASRSAVWSLSVIRMLDVASDGAFSSHLFAISSVSGGSLAAMTYGLWRSKPGTAEGKDERLLDATLNLGRRDMLPAVAARLFSVDLLTGLPSRGQALASAFDEYWNSAGLAEGKPRFANAVAVKCAPLLLLNGVDVETGRRLLTTNLDFTTAVENPGFVAADDTRASGEFSAADAVLNSARFPIVSPPGMIDHGAETAWSVIDGGVYESSGVATAVELAGMLPDSTGARPILVIVSNNQSRYDNPPLDPCASLSSDQAKEAQAKTKTASGGLPVPEILTSLAGLDATRGTRYLAELAKARSIFCHQGDGRIFVFDLPAPQPSSDGSLEPQQVPLNWVLTAENCRFMLGDARLSPGNLKSAARLTSLLTGHPLDSTGVGANLRSVDDAQRCMPTYRAPPAR